MRTFLAVMVGIALMTLAIYYVMLPAEQELPVTSIAAHGLSLRSSYYIRRTLNNAEELVELLRRRRYSELVRFDADDEFDQIRADPPSHEERIEAATLAEHFYIEELIRTDDPEKRQELVTLIRQTRSYRKTLVFEKPDEAGDKESQRSPKHPSRRDSMS